MYRYLSPLLLLATSTMTEAAYCRALMCANFTFPDDSVARELCYTHEFIGPSIEYLYTLPNGTEVTKEEGPRTTTYNFEEDFKGMETSITWENEETEYCNATADGEDCTTCIRCDGGMFEVDCTNLELGRKVECGEQVNWYCGDGVPFIPFLAAKVVDESTTSDGACQVGPEARPDMSCPDGEFCLLAEGVCNTMMSFYTGVCSPIPTVCTFDYNPVW